RRRHTRFSRDWSSDVCSSDLGEMGMDPGAAFQYINKYTLGTGLTVGDDREVKTKISQASLANPDITWEKQKTYNLGFESEFFNKIGRASCRERGKSAGDGGRR